MNREQALRYVTVLSAGAVNYFGLKPSQERLMSEQILRAFLEAFPGRHPGESIYERLGRPVDPRQLAAFKAGLEAQQGARREGETAIQSHHRWAALQLQNVYKPIEHKPPEAVRVIPRPSAAQALWCVAAVERLTQDSLTAEERPRVKAELAEVIEAWDEEVQPYTDDGPCPDCPTGHVQELDAALHLRCCTGHPALARFEAVREAARLLGSPLGSSVDALLPPSPPHPAYGSAWEARNALEYLLATPRERDTRGAPRHPPLALLTRIAREFAHFIDRTTDPCPWCGEVLPLAERHEHLRSCKEHPAEQAARRVRAAGVVPVGLEHLIFERMSNRRELALLSQASATFDTNMGWTGVAAYSDKYSEKPWRAAIERAGKFLRLAEALLERCDEDSSPVRQAMNRLLSPTPQAPRVNRADIATIRAAAAQFDQWVASLGFGMRCPACARKGVPRAHLAAHLERCPLHPAVLRARASAALRQLREGIQVPPLSLGKYSPEDYRDRLHDYLRGKREEALATLYEFESSELSREQSSDLLRFVRDWEELQSVALERPCPWCRVGPGGSEHLMVCAKHPATDRESPRDQLEELAVRLQHEADQCAVRLARLHEACDAFWNGMSDGEDGKSISNPRIEAMWSEARKEASALLAAISERP